jgi:hypothetical protein
MNIPIALRIVSMGALCPSRVRRPPLWVFIALQLVLLVLLVLA